MLLSWLRKIYPFISLILVFLGPYFFFEMIGFLRNLDYIGAFLTLLSGWFLLRAGVDITRIVIASSAPSPSTNPSPSSSSLEEE